ncbi:hypothetical protein GIB67_032360 [Kingdonia uniflora]|uniref:Uncharacterized protein n=1 Tax=Kingdonia uniflora TaxID=39325 RepID=A0A7J7MJ46_9MAGN|nr:hypothetical protein GIB67_032360 [Kingdonia uniflora]
MKAVRAAMDFVAIRWIFIKFNNQLDKVIQEIEAKRISKNVYRTLIENLDKFLARYSEIFSLYESHFKHPGLCWDLNRTLWTLEYYSGSKFNRIPGSSLVGVDDIKDENTDDQIGFLNCWMGRDAAELVEPLPYSSGAGAKMDGLSEFEFYICSSKFIY